MTSLIPTGDAYYPNVGTDDTPVMGYMSVYQIFLNCQCLND